MFSIVTRLLRSEGLRHSALTIFSYSFASGFAALAIMLVSRLLGPVSFADFSVAFALSLLLNRFNDLGLTMAIQKLVGSEWRQAKVSAYLSVALRYRLVLSVILLLVGLLVTPALTALLHLDNPLLISAAFLFSVPVTFFEAAQANLQSLGRFQSAAYNYLLPSLLKFLMAVLIFYFQIIDVTLILSLYLLCTLPGLVIAEWLKPGFVRYQLDQNFAKESAKVNAILKHTAFAVLATGVIDNIDILFAKHYLSAYETGLLAGVGKIAMLLYVVAYALGSVLNPRVAAYKDRANLDAFLRKAWQIAVLTGLSFLLTLPLLRPLITWSIGPAYLDGQGILLILLGAGFLGIALMPFMATFYAFKSNVYFSLSALLQLVIVLVGNIYFVPRFGLEASAWTRLIARSALLVFTLAMLWWSYGRSFGGRGFGKIGRRLLRPRANKS